MCVLEFDKNNKEIKNIVWQYKEIQLSNKINSKIYNILRKIYIKQNSKNKEQSI